MDLQDLTLSKAELDMMPIEEKRLLFLAAHMYNELSVLRRLMSWSLAGTPCENTQEYEARTSQVLFLVRIFVGKLYEAKNTLQESSVETGLREKLEDAEKAHILKKIDRFMNTMRKNDNMFRGIRNKVSFHTDDMALVTESIGRIPDDADLRVYVSDSQRFGSYFGFADIGIIIMLAEQTGQAGLPAINKVVEKSFKAANILIDVLESVLEALLRHGKVIERIQCVTMTGLEAFQDVSIPYFTTPGGKGGEPMPMTIRFPHSISGVEGD